MASSKFARSKHAFRSPDICKKKKEQEPPCDPIPEDLIKSWYDVDVTWFIWTYVFSGTIDLEKLYDYHWQTPGSPPTDGQWGTFDWFPLLQLFSAGLQHWVAGVNVLTITITGAPLPDNCPFNTEQFDYTSALWAGKKFGRIYNPGA